MSSRMESDKIKKLERTVEGLDREVRNLNSQLKSQKPVTDRDIINRYAGSIQKDRTREFSTRRFLDDVWENVRMFNGEFGSSSEFEVKGAVDSTPGWTFDNGIARGSVDSSDSISLSKSRNIIDWKNRNRLRTEFSVQAGDVNEINILLVTGTFVASTEEVFSCYGFWIKEGSVYAFHSNYGNAGWEEKRIGGVDRLLAQTSNFIPLTQLDARFSPGERIDYYINGEEKVSLSSESDNFPRNDSMSAIEGEDTHETGLFGAYLATQRSSGNDEVYLYSYDVIGETF